MPGTTIKIPAVMDDGVAVTVLKFTPRIITGTFSNLGPPKAGDPIYRLEDGRRVIEDEGGFQVFETGQRLQIMADDDLIIACE